MFDYFLLQKDAYKKCSKKRFLMKCEKKYLPIFSADYMKETKKIFSYLRINCNYKTCFLTNGIQRNKYVKIKDDIDVTTNTASQIINTFIIAGDNLRTL